MVFELCKERLMGVENIRRESCQYGREETKMHVGATEIPSPFVLAQAFTRLLISITQSALFHATSRTSLCVCLHVTSRF